MMLCHAKHTVNAPIVENSSGLIMYVALAVITTDVKSYCPSQLLD